MNGSSSSHVVLRPTGCALALGLVFMTLWLAGIVFFARVLAGWLRSDSTPSEVKLMLGAGLAFLALVALASTAKALRMTLGRDELAFESESWTLTRRLGPFERTRTFARGEFARFHMHRRDRALLAQEGARVVELTTFGTPAERRQLVEMLRARYVVPTAERVPPRWTARPLPDGTIEIAPSAAHRRKNGGCFFVVAVVVLAAPPLRMLIGGSAVRGFDAGAVAFAVLLAAIGIFALTAKERWLVRRGSLRRLRSFALWSRDETFTDAIVEVTHSTDSDGDESFSLQLLLPANVRRSLDTVADDPHDLVMMGEYLAQETGWRLVVAAEARE